MEFTIQATAPEDLEKAQDEVVAQLRRVRGVPPRAENDVEVFSNDKRLADLAAWDPSADTAVA